MKEEKTDMIFICSKDFVVNLFDEEGFLSEDDYLLVERGTVWKKGELSHDGTPILDSMDGKNWLDLTMDTIDEHFICVGRRG